MASMGQVASEKMWREDGRYATGGGTPPSTVPVRASNGRRMCVRWCAGKARSATECRYAGRRRGIALEQHRKGQKGVQGRQEARRYVVRGTNSAGRQLKVHRPQWQVVSPAAFAVVGAAGATTLPGSPHESRRVPRHIWGQRASGSAACAANGKVG